MKTSQTGGYLAPIGKPSIPKELTFTQFIQTVLAGVSGLPGEFVRPKWQGKPPKQPDATTNWLAFGVNLTTPDTYAYVGFNPTTGKALTQRHETVEVGCSFYGPASEEIASLVRDGFQISQNLEALTSANMGFIETGKPVHMPELINEAFVNRVEMTVSLRREIQRTYPVATYASANGTITAINGSESFLFNIESQHSGRT